MLDLGTFNIELGGGGARATMGSDSPGRYQKTLGQKRSPSYPALEETILQSTAYTARSENNLLAPNDLTPSPFALHNQKLLNLRST